MSFIKNEGRRAGLWYLGVIVFGIGAEVIRSGLLVVTDGAKSIENLIQNESLFRLGFISDIVMMLCFVFVGLRFYALLKDTKSDLAMSLLIFVLLGVAINMVNLNNYYSTLHWAQSSNASELLFAEKTYRSTYNIANVFYGLWLLPLGVLFIKSKLVPKLVAILVLIGGSFYLLDTLVKFVAPTFAPIVTNIAVVPSSIGEFGITLWLLIRGTKARAQ